MPSRCENPEDPSHCGNLPEGLTEDSTTRVLKDEPSVELDTADRRIGSGGRDVSGVTAVFLFSIPKYRQYLGPIVSSSLVWLNHG